MRTSRKTSDKDLASSDADQLKGPGGDQTYTCGLHNPQGDPESLQRPSSLKEEEVQEKATRKNKAQVRKHSAV